MICEPTVLAYGGEGTKPEPAKPKPAAPQDPAVEPSPTEPAPGVDPAKSTSSGA
jgi:hypothetical protein